MHRDAEWNALAGLPTDKLKLVEALLAHGANPDVRVEKEPPRAGYSQLRLILGGATPFLLAAEAADVVVMRALAESGADTALGTNDNTTPLMAAAGVGRNPAESRVTERQVLEAVTLALELGNDITAANDRGETVLHAAANLKWNSLVQFLVDEGAALNVVNRRGETPLTAAEQIFAGSARVPARTSTGDLLRRLGADPSAAFDAPCAQRGVLACGPPPAAGRQR